MSDIYIWPAYLDASRTRGEGRRVPADSTVEDPTADEVAKAVKQIGYDPVIERDKRYPRSWWRNEGRVRVEEVDDSKRDVLRAAAVYLQAMREDE